VADKIKQNIFMLSRLKFEKKKIVEGKKKGDRQGLLSFLLSPACFSSSCHSLNTCKFQSGHCKYSIVVHSFWHKKAA